MLKHVECFSRSYIRVCRWMPWQKTSKKDVAGCDKLRGAPKQALIRRFPNGETRHERKHMSPLPEHIGQEEDTRGTETS